jgi:hypothetical protein
MKNHLTLCTRTNAAYGREACRECAGLDRTYQQGQRDALAAIPDNDHGSDLDSLDYDGETAYGLAVAREAIQRLIKGDSE